MKTTSSLLTAIAIMLLFTGCNCHYNHKITWEYKDSSGETDLKKFGEEGWELVSAVPHYTLQGGQLIEVFTTFYFKRPIEK